MSGIRGNKTVVSGDSIAVLISPGATALTRMPSRANSAAISRVNADHNPDYLVFLGGQLEHHFTTYFVAAWLLKEPIAALLLTAVGLHALRTAAAKVKWFLQAPGYNIARRLAVRLARRPELPAWAARAMGRTAATPAARA